MRLDREHLQRLIEDPLALQTDEISRVWKPARLPIDQRVRNKLTRQVSNSRYFGIRSNDRRLIVWLDRVVDTRRRRLDVFLRRDAIRRIVDRLAERKRLGIPIGSCSRDQTT